MSTEIVLQGGRADARRAIKRFVGILTGKSPDQGGLARSVFFVLGIAALSDIQEDFIRKSRGGVGEDGVKWKPLSKQYLAYGRRFGKGEQAQLKRNAGLGSKHHRGVGGKGGLLTAQQQKRWNQVYRQTVAAMAARYDIEEARRIAAGHAWNVIKAEGAKTKLEVFGNRQVDMLRDTGVLFNSLSPGYLSSDGRDYVKPSAEGGDQQIFEALRDGILLGSNVAYAGAQNSSRPFLPRAIPDAWQNRWADIGIAAVNSALSRYLSDYGGAAA